MSDKDLTLSLPEDFTMIAINDANGNQIIEMRQDGQIKFLTTPTHAAKLFWSAFQDVYMQGVEACYNGRLKEFNADIHKYLHEEAQTRS